MIQNENVFSKIVISLLFLFISSTINGQEVALTVFEGVDKRGRLVRQAVSGVFDTSGGRTSLSIMGPASGWDQEAVDAFVQSIQ